MEDLLTAANDVVDALGAFWRVFRRYRRVPVRLAISLPGLQRSTTSMAFQMPDDAAVTATLDFQDSHGRGGLAAPGPVTWSVSDPAMASVTPTADGMAAQVQVLPNVNTGSFSVAASSDTLAGKEDVDITPGAPASATLDLKLTPKASAEEAEQVHQGMHRVHHGGPAHGSGGAESR